MFLAAYLVKIGDQVFQPAFVQLPVDELDIFRQYAVEQHSPDGGFDQAYLGYRQSVALVALNINVAPEDIRPLYLGFSNTMMGIALLLTSTLSGVLVESVGFELFFVLALALSGFGVWRVRTLYDPTAR